jgi:UDPglucose--hexose-1-phosphate uridylyltransferase
MSKNRFVQNPITKTWVIISANRAKRPDIAKGIEPICPFCYGHEDLTPPEIFRIGEGEPNTSGWDVRVIPNKFPITDIHELIIHSPDHRAHLNELPPEHVRKIFTAYKMRYLANKDKGQVFIFHNHGKMGAESLPHPHTQLCVVPNEIAISAGRLGDYTNIAMETDKFVVFCPETSEWPYETWVAPKRRGFQFGEIDDDELTDFSQLVPKILTKLEQKLDGESGFNYYIYPGGDWYWRLVPRVIVPGGFEIGTGIRVNIVDPQETIKLLLA